MIAIVQLFDGVLGMFSLALFIWCLLSWFPNINRRDVPWVYLDNIMRPIITPIQRVVPPIGNIDISPFVLLIILQFLSRGVHMLLLHF